MNSSAVLCKDFKKSSSFGVDFTHIWEVNVSESLFLILMEPLYIYIQNIVGIERNFQLLRSDWWSKTRV